MEKTDQNKTEVLKGVQPACPVGRLLLRKRWGKYLITFIGIILLFSGTAFALNGFFGGGDTIPEDTMTRGLVGYWSFNEGGGATAYDASGNGNNGTLINDPKWAKGKKGGAIEFDGGGDYVTITSDDSLDVTTFSLEFWYKISETPSLNYETLIYLQGVFGIKFDSSGNMWADTAGRTMGVHNPEVDKWYHITVVNDGSSYTAYVDGSYGTMWSCSPGNWSGGDLIISYSSNDFNGAVDDVRIYNRALSAEEIRYHYNRGAPVASWDFDEGSGSTVYDASDNNNDGTLTVGATGANSTTSDAWVEGVHGSALNFDGTDDYLEASDSDSLDITNAVTIESWVNMSQVGTEAYEFIRKSGAYTMYLYLAGSSPRMMMTVDIGGGKYPQGSSIIGDYDEWHHLVGVYDGTNIMNYVDGELKASAALSGTMAVGAGSLRINARPLHNGSIDDVRIYDYARTPEEIRLDYNAGFSTKFGPSNKSCSEDPASCMDYGLVGNWSFDEGSGVTAYDASGNDNDGTLTNDPKWTKGKKGGAVEFDGLDDNVTISTITDLEGSISKTIECWVKPAYTDLDGIVHTGSNIIGQILLLRSNSSGEIMFSTYGDDITSSNSYEADTYIHIIAIATDLEMKLYVNGILEAQHYRNNSLNTSLTNVYIGRRGSEMFEGSIDDVRIYNRALSPEEVRYHYNRGGPVASWSFDEGSGSTVYDASDNNNDGTLTVGATGANSTTSDAWVEGVHGSALNFDGTDDHISVPFSFRDSETFSIWVKTSAEGTLLDWSNGVNNGYHDRQLYINGDGSASWYIWNKATITTTGINLKDDSWHHISATGDINGMYIFVDGVQRASRSGDSRSDAVSDTTINIGSFWDGFFNGSIDNVRIYDYARTPEEIRLDYNAGFSTKFGSSNKSCSEDPASCMDYGLVGNWTMDEGSGVTAYDFSGNDNDGILTNDPKWTKGKKGGALEFDGVDDYVEGSVISDILGNTSKTICMWVNPVATDACLFNYGAYANGQAIFLRIMADKINLDTYGDTAVGGTVSYGNWQFVCATISPTELNTFINGVAGTPHTMTKILDTSSTNWRIGTQLSNTRRLNGFIDDVRVYNRALSVEEIRYHYNRGAPLASWNFDEGNGSIVYDGTENNNDGTLLVGATGANSTTSDAWVEGKYNSALDFDGTDDYVNIGDLGIGDNYTAEAWVKADALVGSGDNGSYGFTIMASAAAGYPLWLLLRGTEVKLYAFTSNISGYGMTTDAGLNTGEWFHIVGTATKSGEAKIYVNGVEKLSFTADATSFSNIFTIGDLRPNRHIHFDGVIDDVRIYDYVRTPEQVLLDYNAGYAAHLK